jgi:hypothetical protein
MATPAASQGSMPSRKSHPAITIDNAVTEPTDRSMPPEMSKMVIPTTTMPSTAKAMAIASRLFQLRKTGEANDITTTSTNRMSSKPVSRILRKRCA